MQVTFLTSQADGATDQAQHNILSRTQGFTDAAMLLSLAGPCKQGGPVCPVISTL